MAAVIAIGIGASASAASVYTVSGGAVNGFSTSGVAFRLGGPLGLPLSCSTARFDGNATGLPHADVTPTFTGCTLNYAGQTLPAVFATSGPWRITPTGGTAPHHANRVSILPGSSLTITVQPIPSCTITVNGGAANQNLAGLTSVKPLGAGERVSAMVTGVTRTASTGCPGVPAGTTADLAYSTGTGYIQTATPITIAP